MAEELKVNIVGDASKLKGALNEASIGISKFANKIGAIGKTMTIVGVAVTAVSVGLVKMASDAEETASKFAVVFQDVIDSAAESAKNLADNFGLSSNAAKQLLGDTGDLLTGFGFTGKAALDLATQVNELAVDLASFTNFSGGAEGASRALTKALLGERESVKSLGISILETDVQAKVALLTKQGMTFETERQAKAYATLLIAQEQSKNAIGDFARTSESFANQMRILKARVSDVAVAIGEKLLPMATEMVKKTVAIIEKIKLWVEAHPKLVEGIVKVGATLGIIAAVGGPILLAASAFMRVKTVIDSITFALRLLNIRIGATGAVTNTTLIPALAKIGAKYTWLGAAAGPIAIVGIAIGGLYLAWKTNLFGMRDITDKVFADIKGNFVDLTDTLGGGGGGAGAFFDEVERVNEVFMLSAEASGKLGTGIKALGKTWKDLGKEVRNTISAMQDDFLPTMQDVEDTIYRLTHTEWETSLRNVNRRYDELIDKARTLHYTEERLIEVIKKLNEARRLEIAELTESNAEKDIAIDANNKLAESYSNVSKELDKVNQKTKAYSGVLMTISQLVESQAFGLGGYRESFEKGAEQALDKIARDYNRKGYETVPGIG